MPVHSNTGKVESGNFKASTKTSHRVSPYPIHSKVQNQQTLDQNQFDQIKPYPDAYCNSNILAIEPSCSQSPIEYVEEEPPQYDPISHCGERNNLFNVSFSRNSGLNYWTAFPSLIIREFFNQF